MNELFIGGANAIAFLLCAAFVAYVVCIVIPVLRHRPGAPGDPTQFDWHFLIPCLDEERVIAATVADLLTKFPSCHVWCIDDASQDDTLKILSRLTSRSRQVHVVRRRFPNAQQGKGPALNAGWKALFDHLPPGADLDRIIVGVVDADGLLDPRCLSVISGPDLFGHPDMGAVQILVRVVNQQGVNVSLRARVLTRMQDLEFSCVIAGMQMLRSHVGSSAMGGNGQFTRASALQRVTEVYGKPWQRALVEDFELGLRILLTGGETEYCHDTWVAQQGPPTLGRLVRQRSRWAQGMMQCFRYFMPVMRSREITTGAAMEIAVFLLLPWAQLMGTIVYVASVVVLVYYAVTTSGGPLHWLGAGAWGLIPLFLIFGLAPLACWGPIYRRVIGHDQVGRTEAILLGLANWPYSYVSHVANYWAFGRMLRSRHDWKKTERVPVAAVGTAQGRRLVVPTSVTNHARSARAPAASRTRSTRLGDVRTVATSGSRTPVGAPGDRRTVLVGRSAEPRESVTLRPGGASDDNRHGITTGASKVGRSQVSATAGFNQTPAATRRSGSAAVGPSGNAAGRDDGGQQRSVPGTEEPLVKADAAEQARAAVAAVAAVAAEAPIGPARPPVDTGSSLFGHTAVLDVSLSSGAAAPVPLRASSVPAATGDIPKGMARGTLRVGSSLRSAVVGGRLRVPPGGPATEPAEVGPPA